MGEQERRGGKGVLAEGEGARVAGGATAASSIPVCLTRPYSACMEGQATLQPTQVPVVPLDIASTKSPCLPSPFPLCQDPQEQASWPLLCLQRYP